MEPLTLALHFPILQVQATQSIVSKENLIIVTALINILGAIGTLSVNIYRLNQMEKRQEKQENRLEELIETVQEFKEYKAESMQVRNDALRRISDIEKKCNYLHTKHTKED